MAQRTPGMHQVLQALEITQLCASGHLPLQMEPLAWAAPSSEDPLLNGIQKIMLLFIWSQSWLSSHEGMTGTGDAFDVTLLSKLNEWGRT